MKRHQVREELKKIKNVVEKEKNEKASGMMKIK
jgi:hypothetical protein